MLSFSMKVWGIMSTNAESKIALTKTLVASGLTLIGLTSGSGPVFTLLVASSVGIGGNLFASVIDKGIETWINNWFGTAGILHDHIKVAALNSFVDAILQLRKEWQSDISYNHFVYHQERERAKFSLILLNELLVNTKFIFDDKERFIAAIDEIKNSYMQETNMTLIRSQLDIVIDEYLGPVEQLAEFIKKRLADKWIICFNDYLTSQRGTQAWRALQLLWHASLSEGLSQIDRINFALGSEMENVKSEIEKLRTFLSDWADSLHNRQHINRIDTTFDQLITEQKAQYAVDIEKVYANSQLILEMLKEIFIGLDDE